MILVLCVENNNYIYIYKYLLTVDQQSITNQ